MYNKNMQPRTLTLKDFNRLAKAKVLSIHDGDTLKVAILIRKVPMENEDLGYHLHIEDGWLTMHTNVRLYGLNAPETREEAGRRSRDFLRTHLSIGDVITLKTALNPEDKYGRWLGIIYKGRINLNTLMLKSGHAAVLTY